jgi:hypothetical protein
MDEDMGGSIAQEVSLRLLIAEAWVRNQVSRSRFCGAQVDSGIGFSPSPSVFHRLYHSTAALHSFMCYLGSGRWGH